MSSAFVVDCSMAIYLDLAVRRSLPLATLDEDLRKVAMKLGVALLG